MHSRSSGTNYMATWIYVTNEFDSYFNTIFLTFGTVCKVEVPTRRPLAFHFNATILQLFCI